MKIALVRQRYTAFGGAERFVERALGALAEQGVSLTMIAREWQGSREQPVIICDPFYLGRLWRDWSFARSVSKTIASEQFRLVQSHERIAGCDVFRAGDGVHAAWLEARHPIQSRFAQLATRSSPWHNYTLNAEARLFRDSRLRAVICISQMVRDDIRRFYGVAEEKLHVIYNGIDTEEFSPKLTGIHRDRLRRKLGIPQNAVVFLYVGSGFERKGVRQLLGAFAQVQSEDAYLVIVGKDSRQNAFERYARSSGIGNRVRFTGAQKDVRPYLGAADAFTLPTLYEPLSNAVLEALASGLPVITTTRCGAGELIQHGVSGYVCDALDVNTLAAHMGALLDASHRARASQAAAESVRHLTLESMSQQYLQLYRSLLS